MSLDISERDNFIKQADVHKLIFCKERDFIYCKAEAAFYGSFV